VYIGYRANTGCDFQVLDSGAAADEASLLQYDWMNFKTKVGLEKAVGGVCVLILS